MAKTANLNIRMDPEIKAEAEALFSTFGMTVSDAVNISCINPCWRAAFHSRSGSPAITRRRKRRWRKRARSWMGGSRRSGMIPFRT